jgi:hypothetical protein
MESRVNCDNRSTPKREMGEVGRGETVPEAGELLSKVSRANVDKSAVDRKSLPVVAVVSDVR